MPSKRIAHILLYCSNDLTASVQKCVLSIRLASSGAVRDQLKITTCSTEFGAVLLMNTKKFDFVILSGDAGELPKILEKKRIPSLHYMGGGMAQLVEATRAMFVIHSVAA